MALTLDELRVALGDAIDTAMARVSFNVLQAQYTDINEIAVIDDLPAVVYYWTLNLNRSAVVDVVEHKDYEAMTGYVIQRIPHDIVLQVRVIDREAAGADAMRDAVLREFGDAFCSCGVDFIYQDVDETANAYVRGLFQHVFTFVGLIFLDGRSSEDLPLSQQTQYTVRVGARIVAAPEEPEEPELELDPVVINEVVQDTMEV